MAGTFDTGRPLFEPFAKRGFSGPYKKWCELSHDIFNPEAAKKILVQSGKQHKYDIPKCEETYLLVEESVFYLQKFLNEQDVPFDGFCCFSQGSVFSQRFFHAQ